MLYSLRGRSLPPLVASKISRRFPAKTKYTELMPVHNWLNIQQRFQCKIELTTNDNAQSQVWFSQQSFTLKLHEGELLILFILRGQIPLYSFVGNERIDVAANSQRDYRAVFYCYEKWNFNFKVTIVISFSYFTEHQLLVIIILS
mgnify:CR=1 FL=1